MYKCSKAWALRPTPAQFAAYGAATGGALLVGQTLASMLGDRPGVVPVLSLQGVLFVVVGCAALTLLPRPRVIL